MTVLPSWVRSIEIGGKLRVTSDVRILRNAIAKWGHAKFLMVKLLMRIGPSQINHSKISHNFFRHLARANVAKLIDLCQIFHKRQLGKHRRLDFAVHPIYILPVIGDTNFIMRH